ncbi:MAG TPA: carbohydrate ABC transporter permease [Symbiobacteriaceae bacterium]
MKLSWPARALLTAVVAAGALVMVIPFLYMVSTALTKYAFTMPFPPRIIPEQPTVEEFVRAWTSNHFALYTFNSLYVAVLTVAGVLFFSSLMAYGFARFEFPGKEVLFRILLFTLMVPDMVALIPMFLVMRNLHLLDSRTGLSLLLISNSTAGNTFFLRQFFQALPRELEEAVRIDGGGRWTIYRHVVIPLSQPALATVAIMTFLAAWDEYFKALILIKDEAVRTLPVAIRLFQQMHGTNWSLVFAASLIAMVPAITFFIFGQKYFISGLTSGGVKG